MEYFLFIIFFTGSYFLADKINLKIFKEKNDEILNIFSISIIFLVVYLFNSYQLIINIKGGFVNYFIITIILVSSFFYFKNRNTFFIQEKIY